jgi:branched-chain amino acid transport system substrate-binding protein
VAKVAGTTRRWARGAALVGAMVVIAAACGGDNSGSSNTTAAAATSAAATTAAAGATTTAAAGATTTGAAPTKSELKLGMAIAASGASSSSAKYSQAVAEAWVKYVNGLGGINGHPVTLVVKDSKSDGATGAAVVRELVEQDKVLAVVMDDPAAEAAVGDYTQQQNVPVIGIGYSPATWVKLPNWFPTATTVPSVVQAQFVSAKQVGATKWAAVSCTEVASCASSEPLYAPAAAQAGLQLGSSVKASTTQPNYTAECLQLISSGVDFIQLNIAPAAGQKIAADCRKQGYKGWFGATAGSVVASAFSDPELRLAGGLNGFPWFVDAAPAQAFRAAMDAAGVKDYQDPTSTAVWGSLELFRKAMATASASPTRDEVFTAYHTLKSEDLDGLLPQGMTYPQGQSSPQVTCFWVYKLEGGKFAAVEPTGQSGNSQTSGPLKTACAAPLGG